MKDPGIEEITRGIPVLKPAGMAELNRLRSQGLRQASLYQIMAANKPRLVFVEYANGERRINIWSKS